MNLSLALSSPNLHTHKISSLLSTNFCISLRRGFESRTRKKNTSVIVYAQGKNSNNDSVPVADRVLASVGYFLPFFDGVQYGRFFLNEFPSTQVLLKPLIPAISAYRSFPYASILVFVIFYFSVARNPNISRFVRFNVMQAIVLDVLLIFPDLVDRTFGPGEGIGLSLMISFDNTVFLFILTCLVYGSGSCLLGQVPRLPLVADAADAQVF